MTVIDLAITLEVSDDDKVLEPYRPGAGRQAFARRPVARPGLPRASCGDLDDRGRCLRHGIPSFLRCRRQEG